MVIFKKAEDLQHFLALSGPENRHISFVPTMGALHQGHMSLIAAARQQPDTTVVCSIFVNPTQFNDLSDFEKYPVTIDADILLLIQSGCDVLFLPSVGEMYPNGAELVAAYDFGYLDTILEGAKRPGHFKGVGQVVGRFLDIVRPHRLYLGQKDYQQCMVIQKLLTLTAHNDVELVIVPTKREDDGLAMSSRNLRLTPVQRIVASTIYQCLVSIQSKQQDSNYPTVHQECIDLLQSKGLVPEYVALADASDLTLLDNYDSTRPMVALIAAKMGDVRLIDNMIIN
jgi:pantoate--beta-alanine ligase